MGKLLCRDGMLRLAANVRERPEQWLSRLIFLLSGADPVSGGPDRLGDGGQRGGRL